MQRSIGTRTLVATCSAFAILLAALAVVQYRWSTRVASADAQREREHLETAASLFANEFNDAVGQALEFSQDDAQRALKSGERLPAPPKVISELYAVDVTPEGTRKIKR